MADVSNVAFRLLCRSYGAAMAYTEQISSLALVRNNTRSIAMAETNNNDVPVGLQLFGRNPDTLVQAAQHMQQGFDVIDLNFGCPSKKIVQEGYGAALLKEKDRIHDIISTLVQNIKKPITVKMRSGFKKIEALTLVKVIEQAGASAITIHGRTQAQGYSGKANWDIIKQVKEAVSIPVIGNGDVVDGKSAEALLKHTKCNYIMIARAARSNPWIFKQILHYLETGKELTQTKEEKINMYFAYYNLLHKKHLKNLKETAIAFTKGIPMSSHVRKQMNKLKTEQDIQELLERFRDS